MEGDDGSGTRVALHIVEHLLGVEPFAVVARHNVPHHQLIVSTEEKVLLPLEPSVGRAEEIGMEQLIGFLHIVQIAADAVSESAQMIEGVVANAVSFGYYLLIELRMFANIVAYHEEGGLHLVLAQGFQYKGRYFRNGAVVEG